jgi:hypothetical protein
VSKLHQLLLEGICPDDIESCFPYLTRTSVKGNGRNEELPIGPKNGTRALKKKEVDPRRAVDTVSGALQGLASIITPELADSEHFPYVLKALKEYRRQTAVLTKEMERMQG